MKLGLIADIHEHVHYLRLVLRHFEEMSVDQVIVLGDICTGHEQLVETCELLASARAIGVWGNHDYLICQESDDHLRQSYSDNVAKVMKGLHPKIEIDSFYFAHVPPFLDPESLEDLWYLGGPPEEAQDVERLFTSGTQRVAFCGHFHQWRLYRRSGLQSWNGDSKVVFKNDEQYFIVMGPTFHGHHAILDIDTRVLEPFDERDF